MAKVVIEDGWVDIRVSLLERVMLAEKPRKIPLSSVRAVNPHPALLDMMVHWADQSGVWLCGVSAYDGHLIPSTKNPSRTLALELDEEDGRIYVEVDDEPPERVAERIEKAKGIERVEPAREEDTEDALKPSPLLQLIKQVQSEDDEDDDSWEEEDIRLRDPLMQGSIPPPPQLPSDSAAAIEVDDDRDLARLGGWLVALGSVGMLTGTTIVAAGLVPGLLAVGAGVACAVLGGLALALVAHHQG